MNNDEIDIARAWKDEEYRNSLTPEQLAKLPANPVGDFELQEEELDEISGGRPPYRTPECYSARTKIQGCGC
ncbi:MAG: Type 2 lantibiotic, leader peptide domain [Chloroflexi bacterium]|jgi:mersacidin/lichenicidin family type 2 lantibiotic|nr:Type 2 lantibiotic, leader peptide domain [Chloroflexota bacterium]